MKVITLICESLNRYDVMGLSLEGFVRFKFNSSPSNLSATALFLMQSNDNFNDFSNPHDKSAYKIFSKPNSFIANFAKTRLFSNYWPVRFDPRFLDPLANMTRLEPPGTIHMEPNCIHFNNMKEFLSKEFYKSDYKHLIYWPFAGHAECGECRHPDENKGVPRSLKKTAKHWIDTIKLEIMPLVKKEETIVFIHNDHGTSRIYMGYKESMFDGFLWIYPESKVIADRRICYENSDISNIKNLPPKWLLDQSDYSWSDVRKTLRVIFDIDNKLPPEKGRILCHI